MDVVSHGGLAAGPSKVGEEPHTRQENFVNSVYSSADEAVRRELYRLYAEEGVVPTCKPGCFHCCGQHILANIAEARALVHYVKREFSAGQIEDLRIRTRQWHAWDESRLGRRFSPHSEKPSAFSAYRYCPLLVDGKCSSYAVRPLICRTHFVHSAPPACRSFYDPDAIEDNPVSLASVIMVTNPFSERIRENIENEGLDFCGSIMLLPHWLAIEMDWDFAISMQFR